MRTVYATTVEVGTDADASTALEYVGRWIHDWYRRQRLPIEVPDRLDAGDWSPADGHVLSIRHYNSAQLPHQKLVDIRWEYPDQYDKSLGWIIRLALHRTDQGLIVSLDIAVSGLQAIVAPADFKLGSPRLMRDICRLSSVRIGGHPYNLTPEIFTASDMGLLVNELTETQRLFPIVLVSRRVSDDLPLVDTSEVAERLAGIAKVYELADKWAAYQLTEDVGKPMSCFGGAIRLYWPRFHREGDPFSHPVWMPWQLRDAPSAERTLDHLYRMIFEAAAFRHVEPAAIMHLRHTAEREAREALRNESKKSTDELLDDLIEIEERLKRVEEANGELARENQTLRDNLAAITQNTARQTQISEVPYTLSEESDHQEVPKSVADAVRIAESLGGSVRYLPTAHTSAAESPYKHPERVLQALTALHEIALLWADTVDSKKGAGSVREQFKRRGFDYADDVSQTSKGKWASEYTAKYQRHDVDISPHITLGAKQAETCLSIHWAWHKAEKLALVAHVGRHKTNTKT